MTDVIVNLFVGVHPCKGILTLFLDGNCFLIESTVSECSLQQRMLRMLADEITSSLHNALYDRHSSRYEISFQPMLDETNFNMRYQFQVWWWNWVVRKSFAASLQHSVYQPSQYKEDQTVEFEFLLQSYNSNSTTALSLKYCQWCFVNSYTCQFGNFWLC
jgi:hypothetical protein